MEGDRAEAKQAGEGQFSTLHLHVFLSLEADCGSSGM